MTFRGEVPSRSVLQSQPGGAKPPFPRQSRTCLRLGAAAALLILAACPHRSELPTALVSPQSWTEDEILHSLVRGSPYGIAPDVDVLALPPEVLELLDREIPDSASPELRFDRLLELFQDPEVLDLRYAPNATRTAAQTFATGEGNCLSFTQLFIAMAREEGLRTRFQEVVIPPRWDQQGDVLTTYRHITAYGRIGTSRHFTVDFGLLSDVDRQFRRLVSDQRAKSQYFNNLGAEALARGDTLEAGRYLNRALLLEPALSFVWSNLGVVYMRDQRYRAAETTLHHALRLNPSESAAMNNLTVLYRTLGRDDLAGQYEERIARYRERNPYYHYWLGEAALQDGRPTDAKHHFREAIERKPEEAQFHFMLAKTYFRLQDTPRALQTIERIGEIALDDDEQNYFASELATLITEELGLGEPEGSDEADGDDRVTLPAAEGIHRSPWTFLPGSLHRGRPR